MIARKILAQQQIAARLVGLLYVLTNLTAMFSYYARSQISVRSDAGRTVQNLLEHPLLYRTGLVVELLTVAGVVALVVALYVVLAPVDRNLARLATCWRLLENAILAMIPLFSLAALALLSSPADLVALDRGQISELAYTGMRVHFAAFNVGFLFLGLGSAAFSVVWYKSQYIPRVIAAWGIFASVFMAIAAAAILAKPTVISWLGMGYMAPMGIYEFGLGFWLLIRGIRIPVNQV